MKLRNEKKEAITALYFDLNFLEDITNFGLTPNLDTVFPFAYLIHWYDTFFV
jgi:hypothetical protein